MPIAAALPYIASIGGSLLAANSAKKASDAQVGAGKKASAIVRADLSPYRLAGNAALSRLQQLLGISTAPVAPTKDQFIYSSGGKPNYLDPLNLNNNKTIDPLGLNKSGLGPVGIGGAVSHLFGGGGDEKRFHAGAYNKAMDEYNKNLEDYNSSINSPEYGSLLKNFSKSDLENDPVYNTSLQFGLDEGEKAINNRALASGNYDSGATLKALSRYATDYGGTKASDAYSRFVNNQGNEYSKLFGLVNSGQSAASGEASHLSDLQTGMGNAEAASQIAQGNAYSKGLSDLGDYYQLRQLTGAGQRTA
jgi:hypothetical protein